MWIPELSSIEGPSVHAPWALSLGELKSHGITLGKTYPKPMIRAPEWDKHIHAAKKVPIIFFYSFGWHLSQTSLEWFPSFRLS